MRREKIPCREQLRSEKKYPAQQDFQRKKNLADQKGLLRQVTALFSRCHGKACIVTTFQFTLLQCIVLLVVFSIMNDIFI